MTSQISRLTRRGRLQWGQALVLTRMWDIQVNADGDSPLDRLIKPRVATLCLLQQRRAKLVTEQSTNLSITYAITKHAQTLHLWLQAFFSWCHLHKHSDVTWNGLGVWVGALNGLMQSRDGSEMINNETATPSRTGWMVRICILANWPFANPLLSNSDCPIIAWQLRPAWQACGAVALCNGSVWN